MIFKNKIMIENFLFDMNSCYKNMHDLLELQPKNFQKPFKWLTENNECVKNYMTFLITHYESFNKFDYDEDLKNAWIKTDQKHREFINSFYVHFNRFL
jgi:hypothetical protein